MLDEGRDDCIVVIASPGERHRERACTMVDSRSTHRRVLVVERYAPCRRSICASLAELGHDVVAAATADEARAMMEQRPIDLIVGDVDDEAIRRMIEQLRARRSAVPVVMLTTLADHMGSSAGISLLEKPLKLEALEHAIDAALAQ
jgi:DNA-binding response OmpR family regulator